MIIHIFLVVFVMSVRVNATGTQKYSLFKQLLKDFTEDLVFDQPAVSEVQCVMLCAGTPYCDRAVLSGGNCQGHRWTRECGGSRTLVWERESASTNLLRGKPAVQDTIDSYLNSGPDLAVDGNLTFYHCSYPDDGAETPHWWQVDMQATYNVLSVTIDNSQYRDGYRQWDFDIQVYTEDPETNPAASGSLCYSQVGAVEEPRSTLQCDASTAPGRFLRITTMREGLLLCEVEAEVCFVSR